MAVFPSRMVLQSIKERSNAARKGWDLLKRKSDAIKLNLNNKLKEILAVKRRVGEAMRKSAFAHTEAVWAAGDFNNAVIESTKEASFKVRTTMGNVAGVKIPNFERVKDDTHRGESMVGLSRGGEQVVKCRQSFLSTLEDLIKLASLQTSVKTLDEALKVTNRRVNALEFVIMPMLVNTIKYINSELDELEREDNYRIKKVKDLRAKQQEIYDAEAELTAQEEAELRARKQAEREDDQRKVDEAPSLLATSEEEEDVTDAMMGL